MAGKANHRDFSGGPPPPPSGDPQIRSGPEKDGRGELCSLSKLLRRCPVTQLRPVPVGWSRASPSGESSPPPPMDMPRVGASARDGGGAAGARRPPGSPAAGRGPESGCHPHADRRKDKRKDRRRAGVALHGRVCCLWTAGSREPEPRPCPSAKTSRRAGPGLPVGASAARRERRAGWGCASTFEARGPPHGSHWTAPGQFLR